jgi:fructokinase
VKSNWIAAGVDVGGTKIEVAVVRDVRGELVFELRERVPTLRDEGYDAIVARTADLVRSSLQRAGLDAQAVPLGVGMPGGVSRRTGFVKNSNTVCLNGRPFRADLCRALGREVPFDNDATLFTLAEARYGAARAHHDSVVFGVILGTGVGGGIAYRGAPWSGLQGIAGEWGHHAVFAGAPDARACYCGQRGCLEAYASGPAVEATYEALSGSHLGLDAIAARRETDPHATAALDGLIDAFGRGLANVIDILDPAAVVLGGGVSNVELLYDEGVRRVERYVFNDELMTPIVKNQLGDSAGVVGAALLALEKLR